MTQTYAAQRIDVIVDQPLVPRIVEALAGAGINGWSVLPLLQGSGRSGGWRDERLTTAETKVVVMAIAPQEAADAAVDALAPLLDSHRLLLTLSEVRTVRRARFG